MTAKIAIKLGGSVLENKDSYKKQAEKLTRIIKDYDLSKLYVVVSARKGDTDKIIKRVANPRDEKLLRKALRGECRFPKYEIPETAARLLEGEIKSALLLKSYLPDARVLIQDSCFPIVANGSYLHGTIDFEESYRRKSCLEISEQIVIVPGFGAVNLKGDKVLLGRNSSDLVAAMIAKLGKAEKLIYLKDVEGIYRNFRLRGREIISKLTCQEAKEIDLGCVLDKRILEVLQGSKLKVVVGHHKRLPQLINPSSNHGTSISFR